MQAPASYAPDQLLNQKQAAELLGASERTLEKWRVHGGGPRFIKQSSRFIRYRVSALVEWMDAHEVAHTAEYAVSTAG